MVPRYLGRSLGHLDTRAGWQLQIANWVATVTHRRHLLRWESASLQRLQHPSSFILLSKKVEFCDSGITP